MSDPDEVLKETARDAVVEIWKISTQKKKRERGDTEGTIQFLPVLAAIERLTKDKVQVLVNRVEANPDVVAKILEGKLRTSSVERGIPPALQMQSEASLLFTPMGTPSHPPTSFEDAEDDFSLGPSQDNVLSNLRSGGGGGITSNSFLLRGAQREKTQDGISLAASERQRFAASLDDW